MKIFKLILSVAIVLIVSSCVERKYDNTETVAIVGDTIKTIIEDTATPEDVKSSAKIREEKIEEIKKLPELEGYTAQYRFTDKKGDSYDIFITKEQSGVIIDNKGGISYTDYYEPSEGFRVTPAKDSNITICFEGGNYEKSSLDYYIWGLQIIGDWIYHEEYASKKHPKWRLPVERIGGKDMGKGSKKENGSTKVKSTVTVKESRTSSSQKLSPEEQRELEMAERANSIFKSQHDAVYDSYKERK